MTAVVNDAKDGVSFTAAKTADTIGPFVLLGGKYVWGTSAPSTSTTLDILMPDGSTWQPFIAAVTAAAMTMLDLPAGTYKIIFTDTTGTQGFVARVPYIQ